MTGPPVVLPPEAVIERARRLTREEIVRLDRAERRTGDVALTAWDLLRDRMSEPRTRALRFEARNRAWAAVAESLSAWTCGGHPMTGIGVS